MLFIYGLTFDDSKTGSSSSLSHNVTVHMGNGNSVFLCPIFAGTFLSDAGSPDDVCQGLSSVEKGANDEEAGDGKDEGKEGHVDDVHWLVGAT